MWMQGGLLLPHQLDGLVKNPLVERNPFLTIIVTGIPGVGKTTVLRYVKKLAEKEGIHAAVYNFGDFMLKEALKLGLVKHRDELRRLPLRTQLTLQERAAKAIIDKASSELDSNSILFVDTHAVVATPAGFWPGLPHHVVRLLKPDSIVVIESSPEVIVSRQVRDCSRVRSDISDVELVRSMLEAARIAAMSSAVVVGATVYVVENVEGDPTIAARSIISLVKSLRS